MSARRPEIDREVRARWGGAGVYWSDGGAFYVGHTDKRGRKVVVGGSRYSYVDALMDADRHPSKRAPRPNPPRTRARWSLLRPWEGVDWQGFRMQSVFVLRDGRALVSPRDHDTGLKKVTGIDHFTRAHESVAEDRPIMVTVAAHAGGRVSASAIVSYPISAAQARSLRVIDEDSGGFDPLHWNVYSGGPGGQLMSQGGNGLDGLLRAAVHENPPRWLCAWCRRWMGEDKKATGQPQPASVDRAGVSHGICSECEAREMAELDRVAPRRNPGEAYEPPRKRSHKRGYRPGWHNVKPWDPRRAATESDAVWVRPDGAAFYLPGAGSHVDAAIQITGKMHDDLAFNELFHGGAMRVYVSQGCYGVETGAAFCRIPTPAQVRLMSEVERAAERGHTFHWSRHREDDSFVESGDDWRSFVQASQAKSNPRPWPVENPPAWRGASGRVMRRPARTR